MLDFENLKEIILGNDNFILTSHVNPDPDAIGSVLALKRVFNKLNKKSHIILHNDVPYNLRFMDFNNEIEQYKPELHDELILNSGVLFALDINNLERTVSMCEILNEFEGIKICIDHHQNPKKFEDFSFSDISYESTGSIIYDFIKATNIVELDYEIAHPIYCAIMTDTGSFRYERTTSKTHLTAAELLDLGVDPNDVHDKIYDQSKPGRLKLLGKALSELGMNETNEICYMKITQEMLNETGVEENEVDGFVGYTLSIEGVKIGLLFFELTDGIKISFRSKGKIPINKLAAEFGGGGHTNAAGTRLFNVNFEETIEKVLNKANNYLEYK